MLSRALGHSASFASGPGVWIRAASMASKASPENWIVRLGFGPLPNPPRRRSYVRRLLATGHALHTHLHEVLDHDH
jgi:hypothetical protein